MALDIQGLKKIQPELERKAKQETTKEVLQFLKSEYFENLLVKEKVRKETNQSPRVLNNWENAGLIEKIDTASGKFRTFNRCQSIWLEIVIELREFGFALNKIKQIKDSLFGTKLGEMNFSVFEFALIQSILSEPQILIVYNDGKIKLSSLSSYKEQITNELVRPHLSFNILTIVSREFPTNNFNSIGKVENLQKLKDNELALLYLIRTGDFDTIKVKMKEGDIYLVEGMTKIPPTSKFTDIIKQRKYQDIEIKTQNGEIIYCTTTEKIKL